MDEILLVLGYRPEDDSWDTDGRLTYIHDDNATHAWMTSTAIILGRQGWRRDKTNRYLFRHDTGRLIEIEPGGADCTGHYLHVMKAEAANVH